MQQMGCRMIGAQPRAAFVVHAHLHRIAERERARGDAAEMHMHVAELLLGIGNCDLHALGADEVAGIAHLAA